MPEARKSELQKELEKYPHPHIMLNPGAYYTSNRAGRTWNIEKWKELSKRLIDTYGGTIFVNGAKREYEEHLKLENERVHILSGKYSLQDSSIILGLSDLVISGDSGPVHIASAFNVKTIAILGSTSPDKIKPYGENGYFVEPTSECRYCWQKKCKKLNEGEKYSPCIESISVDMVMEKVKQIF
jgi:ADP-heptose:LPS heptosyltransferase